MKAAARKAYGTQLPKRDQGMVPCQDHLTAWHSPPEPPVSGGKCWHSARAHSLRLAPQPQAVLEPVGPRGCVRVALQLGAVLEEGRLPQGMPHLGQTPSVLPEGAWVYHRLNSVI